MPKKLKVLILMGGCSAEHKISLCSAQSVIEALDRDKYEIISVIITPEGKWLLSHPADPLSPKEDRIVTLSLSRSPHGVLLLATEQGKGFERLIQDIGVVFPVLHGPYGEDGTVQGFCEIADLPYVGSGVLASAVGMDKGFMKIIFQAAKFPITDFFLFKMKEWETSSSKIVETVEKSIDYPVFVKPAALGSSIGISKAHNRSTLVEAITVAGHYHEKILIEKAIECRELECGVLGDEEPQASVVAEIIPKGEFYDFEAKYSEDLTYIKIPASLPESLTRDIQRLSIEAFKAIEASGMARVDFFLEKDTNKIYLNEINTIPGFTATSVYPKMWEVSGVPYPQLLDRLIELAIERHKKKRYYLAPNKFK
jgi:D-alanine-D-alanine ligase